MQPLQVSRCKGHSIIPPQWRGFRDVTRRHAPDLPFLSTFVTGRGANRSRSWLLPGIQCPPAICPFRPRFESPNCGYKNKAKANGLRAGSSKDTNPIPPLHAPQARQDRAGAAIWPGWCGCECSALRGSSAYPLLDFRGRVSVERQAVRRWPSVGIANPPAYAATSSSTGPVSCQSPQPKQTTARRPVACHTAHAAPIPSHR